MSPTPPHAVPSGLNSSGGQASPPIPLPTDTRIPVEDLEFRRVSVAGQYMNEIEMHLLSQVRDGIPGIKVFFDGILVNHSRLGENQLK